MSYLVRRAMSHDLPARSLLLRRMAGLVALVWLLLFPCQTLLFARETTSDGEPQKAAKAYLVPIALPITGTVDTQVKQRIDQILAALPPGDPRPILILEFRARPSQAGEGSEFERCLSLARYLASDRVSGVRTVAYLPGTVKGHAVLPVIACEEIIIHPDAELGEAGRSETYVDPTMRRGYGEIAERRRTIPVAVVLGMLDKQLAVSKVQTVEGAIRYVLEDELQELKSSQNTSIVSVESVVRSGDLGRFTGRELRLKYGFASHLAQDRGELAAALDLRPESIEEDPSLGGRWNPIRVDIQGPIHSQLVSWMERSVRQRMVRGDVNLLCICLESPGGSVPASMRLAGYLASLNPSEIRTIAYVPAEARADAALIALACDHLVMGDDAVLGGPGAAEIPAGEMPELRRAIQSLAQEKHRGWSLFAGLIDPDMVVHRYSREGTSEVRYFCQEELDAQDQPGVWTRGGALAMGRGLSGREAEEVHLARYLASNFQEFQQLYQLDGEVDALRPSWAHLVVEQLASPKIAGVLLFVAWFALLMEFSQPGLGIAGFVSALCFVLYFWSHFLHGTAGWLEVLLFVVGVTSVLIELLVIPGFGVFGFGGALLIMASIILASQTFVIPRNSYQLEQLPSSLFMVASAGAGAFASLVVMRRYLADAPVLKRLVLDTPDEEGREVLAQRESLVDYCHLRGKRGRTTTQLTPGGKARFGDEWVDVMSAGEMIPAHADVRVTEVLGSHVYVQRIEQDRE